MQDKEQLGLVILKILIRHGGAVSKNHLEVDYVKETKIKALSGDLLMYLVGRKYIHPPTQDAKFNIVDLIKITDLGRDSTKAFFFRSSFQAHIGKFILAVLVLVIGGVFATYLNEAIKKDVWTGYFYPDRNDLSSWIESEQVLGSLEECRAWSEDIAVELGKGIGMYDYECGLNCESKDDLNICDKTLD